MADLIIGSARHDELGKYHGGKPGDQLQTGTGDDFSGEVSMQPFYTHKKGWLVLRPKSAEIGDKLAAAMKAACNNSNIGYDQDTRDQIIKAGIKTKKKVNADCSSLVRACVITAAGVDPGDFDTSDEAEALMHTGLFEGFAYKSSTVLYPGDVLVTKTKGHTAIVVSSPNHREEARPVIKKGYKDSIEGGSWCAELQEDLNKLGYRDQNGDTLAVDGSCGGKTDAAIRNLQAANSLEVDGHCGPRTWAKIDELLAGKRVTTTTTVYCRYGPGVTYAYKCVLPQGKTYTQTTVKDGWSYLKEPEGWVSNKYLK